MKFRAPAGPDTQNLGRFVGAGLAKVMPYAAGPQDQVSGGNGPGLAPGSPRPWVMVRVPLST